MATPRTDRPLQSVLEVLEWRDVPAPLAVAAAQQSMMLEETVQTLQQSASNLTGQESQTVAALTSLRDGEATLTTEITQLGRAVADARTGAADAREGVADQETRVADLRVEVTSLRARRDQLQGELDTRRQRETVTVTPTFRLSTDGGDDLRITYTYMPAGAEFMISRWSEPNYRITGIALPAGSSSITWRVPQSGRGGGGQIVDPATNTPLAPQVYLSYQNNRGFIVNGPNAQTKSLPQLARTSTPAFPELESAVGEANRSLSAGEVRLREGETLLESLRRHLADREAQLRSQETALTEASSRLDGIEIAIAEEAASLAATRHQEADVQAQLEAANSELAEVNWGILVADPIDRERYDADRRVLTAQNVLWADLRSAADDGILSEDTRFLNAAIARQTEAYGTSIPPALLSPSPAGIDLLDLAGANGGEALESALRTGISTLPYAVFRGGITMLTRTGDGPWDALDLWSERATGLHASGDESGAQVARAAATELVAPLTITVQTVPTLRLQAAGTTRLTAETHGWHGSYSLVVSRLFDLPHRFGSPVPLPPDGSVTINVDAIGALDNGETKAVTALDAAGNPVGTPLTFRRNPDGTLWVNGQLQLFRDLTYTETHPLDRPSVRAAFLDSLAPDARQQAAEFQAHYGLQVTGTHIRNEWGQGEVRLYSPALDHWVNITPNGAVYDMTERRTILTLDPAFSIHPELLDAAVPDDHVDDLATSRGYTLQETYAAGVLVAELGATSVEMGDTDANGVRHAVFVDAAGQSVATLEIRSGTGRVFRGEYGSYLTELSNAAVEDLGRFLATGAEAAALRGATSLLPEITAFLPERVLRDAAGIVTRYRLYPENGSIYSNELGRNEESAWSSVLGGWVVMLPDGRLMEERELLQSMRDPSYARTLLATVDRAFAGRLGVLVTLPDRVEDRQLLQTLPLEARARLASLGARSTLDLQEEAGNLFAVDTVGQRAWVWDLTLGDWRELGQTAGEPEPVTVVERSAGWDVALRQAFAQWMIGVLGLRFPDAREEAKRERPDFFGRTPADDLRALERKNLLETGATRGPGFDSLVTTRNDILRGVQQRYDREYDLLLGALTLAYEDAEARMAGEAGDPSWRHLVPAWANAGAIARGVEEHFATLYREAMSLNRTFRNMQDRQNAAGASASDGDSDAPSTSDGGFYRDPRLLAFAFANAQYRSDTALMGVEWTTFLSSNPGYPGVSASADAKYDYYTDLLIRMGYGGSIPMQLGKKVLIAIRGFTPQTLASLAYDNSPNRFNDMFVVLGSDIRDGQVRRIATEFIGSVDPGLPYHPLMRALLPGKYVYQYEKRGEQDGFKSVTGTWVPGAYFRMTSSGRQTDTIGDTNHDGVYDPKTGDEISPDNYPGYLIHFGGMDKTGRVGWWSWGCQVIPGEIADGKRNIDVLHDLLGSSAFTEILLDGREIVANLRSGL